MRVVVRHKLDDRLSRFVRLPNWYFRDISTPKLANETVDWWFYPYGFNASFIPNELQDGEHWLTPKKRDEMGAFLMPGGRNDIGQLGLGHAMNLRVPRLNDDADVAPLELERLSAGERSTLGISTAPGNVSRGNVYSWGDGKFIFIFVWAIRLTSCFVDSALRAVWSSRLAEQAVPGYGPLGRRGWCGVLEGPH